MHQPPLILIVDDEPDIIAVYKAKLEREGFSVLTAENGERGVEVATKEVPDLVLMDLKMPVMDGVAAQQKIRENPATKDMKIVFLTAFSDPVKPELDETLAKSTGAIDFLKKGGSLSDLVSKIKGYLEIK